MSRIFNFLNRRPKRTSQVVRFKTTETIVEKPVLVPATPVVELPEVKHPETPEVKVATPAVATETSEVIATIPNATEARDTESMDTRWSKQDWDGGGSLNAVNRMSVEDTVRLTGSADGYKHTSLSTPAAVSTRDDHGMPWEVKLTPCAPLYNRDAIVALLKEATDEFLPTRVLKIIECTSRLPHLLALLENENWHAEYRVIRARVYASDESILNAYRELGIA